VEKMPDFDYRKQILSKANMIAAWEDVRSKHGSPGIDEITVLRWNRNWEANIERLIEQVNNHTYHPNRPKRITVLQKNGKQRELSLLTVTDKVLQRACLNIIEPMFDSRFLGCSHGYRKKHSTATAIHQLLNNRDKGLRWVLDADLLDCFDHIHHPTLIRLVNRVVSDAFVNDLLEAWLKAGRKHRHIPSGIPQGGVISPLLCNIYLHQLDARMTCNRWHFIRYADDFVVMTVDRSQAEQARTIVETILTQFHLQFNVRKTRVTNFDEGFTFLGVRFLDDSYHYIWQNKKVEVQGKELKTLYNYIPEFYF